MATPTPTPTPLPASPLAAIARLSAPLALLHIGQVTLGLVDTAFVGRLGKEALAAVALGNSVFFTLAVLGVGLVLGAEPIVAQAVGAGDGPRARRALAEAVTLAVVASLPILLLLALVSWALPFTGIDPAVVPLTREYVLGRAPGLPPFLLFMALRTYLQAHGRTRSIVVSVVVANVFNVPADLLLIFGDEGLSTLSLPGVGLQGLGVLGAGLATSLASLSRLVVIWLPTRALAEETGPRQPARLAGMLAMGRVGIPVGLQTALEVAIFAFVSFFMGRLGAEELAAHHVALSLASGPFQVTLGIGSATAVVVGQRIGAGDGPGSVKAGAGGVGLGLLVMAVTGALFLLAPAPLIRIFTDDVDVQLAATPLVRIAGAFALSDGVQAVVSGALRGAGDTAWAFVLHLLAHWAVGMPAALGLGLGLGLGPEGLWWGLTAGLTFAAVALSWRFFTRAKRGYASLADPPGDG